jgi:DNA topoisomerase-1
LPREVGLHPETKEKIEAGIGRFGPYVKMGAVFGSLDKDDDVLALGLNRAVDLLAKKLASVRTIGPHPADKDLVSVKKGRFGPYVQHGKTVANLPRGVAMEDISLEGAVALLADKGKALKPKGAAARKGKAKAPAKAAATAEKAPRKAPAKKAAPKKKAAVAKTPAKAAE